MILSFILMLLLTNCTDRNPDISNNKNQEIVDETDSGNGENNGSKEARLTTSDYVRDIVNHPAFDGFGELLLTYDNNSSYYNTRLSNVGSLMPYHGNVRPDVVLDAVNYLIDEVSQGKTIFYDIYTEQQKQQNPTKRNAVLFFTLITLLFLDFTGTFHVWFGWMAKIQLVPAILATNIVIILSLIVLTLLFGRVYCSVICPLGIFQDGVSNLSGRRKGKKNRFRYSAAKSWLRYGVLTLFIIALVAGTSVIVSLLDPYAAYGRMASNLFAPVYRLGNNLLALLAERADSYAIYSTDVWIKGWITFGVAAITLIIVGALAWRHGRTYCNTICPVGTFLGFLSKFSLFRLTFDKRDSQFLLNQYQNGYISL